MFELIVGLIAVFGLALSVGGLFAWVVAMAEGDNGAQDVSAHNARDDRS